MRRGVAMPGPGLLGAGRSQRCRSTGRRQATASAAIAARVGLYPDPDPMAGGDLASGCGFLCRYDTRHGRRVAGILVDGEQAGVRRYIMSHRSCQAYQCGDHGPSLLPSLSHTPTVAFLRWLSSGPDPVAPSRVAA